MIMDYAIIAMMVLACCCGWVKSDLEEDFRVLSRQVSVLLDKRTEDVKSIEDHIRTAILDMPEIADIRTEIKKIR